MYTELRKIGHPVIETREAAARLHTSTNNATQRLQSLEKAGLVLHLRRGLWALDSSVKPAQLAPYLTTPFPSYVSFWSALARHGMIEQIPGQVFVASLDRTRTIETSLGTYSIHHLTPDLFTGFDGSPEDGYIARPEKALFDTVYIRAPRGERVYLPELTLPAGFDEQRFAEWLERIERPRLRTLVARALEAVLARAERE